jgi:hypothetical protein
LSKMSRLLFVFVSCLAGIQAQVQRPGALLAADSPELYKSFFYTHSDLSNFVEQKITAEPSAKSRLEDGAARNLRVNREDLSKISVVSKQVVTDLRKIDDDERAHFNQRAKLDLGGDPAVMKEFVSRRQAVVSAGMDKLSKTLPAASWDGLRSFINGRHRQGLRAVEVGRK